MNRKTSHKAKPSNSRRGRSLFGGAPAHGSRRHLTLETLELRRLLVGDILVKVSDDPNADGINDPNEDRLSGWTIFLDNNLNGALDVGEPSLISDSRGEAIFSGLAAGNYRVGEIVQPHYTPTTPSLVNARVRDDRQENVSFLNFHPLIGNLDGTVWNDLNGDGLRATDPATGAFTEPGTPGRIVFLDSNHDGLPSPGELSTTTDANGQYAFNNLASGSYAVTEILPAGWEATTGFSVARTVSVRTDLTTTTDFGNFLTQPVTIKGTVWNDLDENGARATDPITGEFTEPGLAGRSVFVDVNGDELLSPGEPSAVTDAAGLYTITDASHGTFSVRQIVPTDWLSTAPASGARTLNLLNGQTQTGIDFGSTTAKTVTIQGVVWNDVDGNGVRKTDPISGAFTELGVEGWQMFVDVNSDGLLTAGEPSAITDSTGFYSISGADRGTLTVREVPRTDWLSTVPATGARTVVLHNGQTLAGVDFGNHQRQESSILGTVYFDANHNGVRDVGERGLAGITLFLDVNNDGVLDPGEPQTVSSVDRFFTPGIDETGTYSFTHLAAGTYHVRELVPVDQSATPDSQRVHDVTLVTTETHSGIDFGNVYRANEIHGVAFDDVNHNHVHDAGEPNLAGVTVYIDRNRNNLFEADEPSTTTDVDGAYAFTNLTPGAYVVREIHSSGHEGTYPNTIGGILWPSGVSNPASGNVSPISITTSLAEGETHHETVSLTLPGSGGLTNLVDVFLLFDDTGSFTGNSPIVRAAFPEIIASLQASLPGVDLGFGVGRFEEYGSFASELPTGRPFILNQPIVASSTTGFSTSIQAALDRVAPGFGGDGPETLIEALYQTVTGLGFDGNNNGTVSDSGAAGLASTQVTPGSSGDVPAFSSFTADATNSVLPAAGILGGAGFRPGALPIILAATDTGFAYQPQGETSITGLNGLTLPLSALVQASRPTTPFNSGAGIQQTITGLNALGALVVGLGVNANSAVDPRHDLEAIARLTGATNQSADTIANGTATPIAPGDPLYFQIGTGFGGTVANGVVNAIQNAATHVAVNVTLRASDPRVHIINHTGTINGLGAGQTATFDVEFDGDGRPHRFDLQFVREGTDVVLGSIPVVLGTPIPGDNYEYEDLEDGEIHHSSDFGSAEIVPSTVVGRQVFYNQSKFDGNGAGVSASDDLAIATDKVALLPGAGQANFTNITSYTRGINGIMVDIQGTHGTLTDSDFIFKVGANNTPSLWTSPLETPTVTVRPGAGTGGSDRVEIIFTAANAPKNQWLEVVVKGNDTLGSFNSNTGLAASDTFFFGNRIGEDGSGTAGQAITSFVDENAARTHSGAATITNAWDFDRTGIVSATDGLASRFNAGSLTKINIANPPAAPVAAPAVALAGAAATDSGIASALAAKSLPKVQKLPGWITNRLASLDLNAGPIARYFTNLAENGGPRATAILKAADVQADKLGLDDSLLDDLLAGLLGRK